MNQLSLLTAVILAGIVAGTVDIGAASLISGKDPVFISQVIAGGLLGKAALAGGVQTAALGVALQWAMSMIIAAIFILAGRALPILREQWLLTGILYGVPVYFVMEYVVLPLSAWHRSPPFALDLKLAENMLAMMVFGVIIAFFASRTRG